MEEYGRPVRQRTRCFRHNLQTVSHGARSSFVKTTLSPEIGRPARLRESHMNEHLRSLWCSYRARVSACSTSRTVRRARLLVIWGYEQTAGTDSVDMRQAPLLYCLLKATYESYLLMGKTSSTVETYGRITPSDKM